MPLSRYPCACMVLLGLFSHEKGNPTKRECMNYNTLLSQARQLILDHYLALEHPPAAAEGSADEFIRKLKAAGGTSADALKMVSWEDLRDLGLPPLLAKSVAKVFRGGDGSEEKPQHTSEKKARRMPFKQLLELYDPADADNEIGKRLREVSNGQRFIIFQNGKVLVEPSATLLDEIRQGFPDREVFMVEGQPLKTYRVGERPGNYADENPLYPGRALRPNGDCDQTNRNWTGVDDEIRTLLYLAVKDTGELKISRLKDAHDALDLVIGKSKEEARRAICTYYPHACQQYNELKEIGQLPSLKLARTQAGSNRRNDPFGVGTNRTF